MRKRWIKRKTSKHGEFGLKKTWCLSCLLGPKVLFLVHKMEQLFSLLSVHFQEKKNRKKKKKKKKRRKRHQLCSTLTWSRGWHAWMWGHLSFIAWLLLVLCLLGLHHNIFSSLSHALKMASFHTFPTQKHSFEAHVWWKKFPWWRKSRQVLFDIMNWY